MQAQTRCEQREEPVQREQRAGAKQDGDAVDIDVAFDAWARRQKAAAEPGARRLERGDVAKDLLDWAQRGSNRAARMLVAWLEGARVPADPERREHQRGLARTLAAAVSDPGLAARALVCEARRAGDDARALFAEVLRSFPGTPAAKRAADDLWRLEHLAPGQPAPAWTARDAFGNEVSLADQRGRVTVVRFLPRGASLRSAATSGAALYEAHWDEPFSLIDVVRGGGRRELVRQLEASAEVRWPMVWDGARGPLAAAWRQGRAPCSVVIDRLGRVRLVLEEVSGETLAGAIRDRLDRPEALEATQSESLEGPAGSPGSSAPDRGR